MIIVYIIFIISLLGILHAYLGYPVSLYLLSIHHTLVVKNQSFYPRVTFIITAYNEEAQIENKIRNTLALQYLKEALEILVVSDGSTDGTNAIVQNFAPQGVKLLALETRAGKEHAQKRAIEIASGEVLVFSDVATFLEPSGLEQIVSNFADSSIGCVSSEDRLQSKKDGSSGEDLYVKYEMWLRLLESKVSSLVGLSGSFFAARKEVFNDFSGDMQSDFRTVLNSIKLGLRGVSDPEAIGYYIDVCEGSKEFHRKIRTIIRGLAVFFNNTEFLNPFVYGLFAYQYFCHKLLRWSVPFLLISLFISNVILAISSQMMFVVLILHILFYASAVTGWLKPSLKRMIFVKIPCYFSIVNISILIAWIRYLRGERIVMWQPTTR